MRLNGKDIYLSFLKGDKGDKGEQGLKGDKGDTALSVKVGTVTTSKAGTLAKVTNSGTNTDLVLNFNIPKGDKGEQGIQGVKGDSGVASGVVLSNAAGKSDQNGYTQAAVNGLISNPNLLINGDFRINQRGKTSYSGHNIYSFDRWKLSYYTSVNVATKTITITAQYGAINQILEDFEFLKGKTVTVSCKVANVVNTNENNDLWLSAGGQTYNTQITGDGIYSQTYTIPSDYTGNAQGKFAVGFFKSTTTGQVSFTIEWVKFEIGAIATAFVPRPYAEELLLCQRYYQIIKVIGGSGTFGNFGIPRNTTTIRFLINLITQMRTIPTTNIGTGTGGVASSNISIINLNTGIITTIDDNSLSLQCETTNQVALNYTTTGLTLGHIYVLTDTNGQIKIEFDAEMY